MTIGGHHCQKNDNENKKGLSKKLNKTMLLVKVY